MSAMPWQNDFGLWNAIVESLSYKPGYKIRLAGVEGRPVLEVRMWTVDTYSYPGPPRTIEVTHMNVLPPYPGEERYARQAIRTLLHKVECHESDEFIRFDGEMVFDPHA